MYIGTCLLVLSNYHYDNLTYSFCQPFFNHNTMVTFFYHNTMVFFYHDTMVMIPGSKGLHLHELAHRWVKYLGTPTSYHTSNHILPMTYYQKSWIAKKRYQFYESAIKLISFHHLYKLQHILFVTYWYIKADILKHFNILNLFDIL